MFGGRGASGEDENERPLLVGVRQRRWEPLRGAPPFPPMAAAAEVGGAIFVCGGLEGAGLRKLRPQRGHAHSKGEGGLHRNCSVRPTPNPDPNEEPTAAPNHSGDGLRAPHPTAPPPRCHQHRSCAVCIGSYGAEGGCVWSDGLQQCLSPAFTPWRCAGGGGCGRLRRLADPHERQGEQPTERRGAKLCPAPCQGAGLCAACLRMPGCGWCAPPGGRGLGGQCLEGGPAGPREALPAPDAVIAMGAADAVLTTLRARSARGAARCLWGRCGVRPPGVGRAAPSAWGAVGSAWGGRSCCDPKGTPTGSP